jgi:hypothetical protein
MRNITPYETTIPHLPSVILTPLAFEEAHEHAFRGIEPDEEGMLAIRTLTNALYMPDITIMQACHGMARHWDQAYADAPNDFIYIPSSALAQAAPASESHLTKADIQRSAAMTGKVILNLTVEDWTNLGSTLAHAIEESKGQSPGLWSLSHARTRFRQAMGPAVVRGILGQKSMSPAQQRIKQAASIQPYRIIRGIETTA